MFSLFYNQLLRKRVYLTHHQVWPLKPMHLPETHSMAFNLRLAFAWTNIHNAQLYKDPMKCWVIKIEKHPTTFDPSPWVNYQGEIYMG